MSTESTVWSYSSCKDAEQWDGDFATREEAIAEGRAYYADEGAFRSIFFVAPGSRPDPGDLTPRASDIVDQMCQIAGDNCGECAEDWPDVGDDALKELDELIEAWARKHCPCNFWTIDSSAAEEVSLIP